MEWELIGPVSGLGSSRVRGSSHKRSDCPVKLGLSTRTSLGAISWLARDSLNLSGALQAWALHK